MQITRNIQTNFAQKEGKDCFTRRLQKSIKHSAYFRLMRVDSKIAQNHPHLLRRRLSSTSAEASMMSCFFSSGHEEELTLALVRASCHLLTQALLSLQNSELLYRDCAHSSLCGSSRFRCGICAVSSGDNEGVRGVKRFLPSPEALTSAPGKRGGKRDSRAIT